MLWPPLLQITNHTQTFELSFVRCTLVGGAPLLPPVLRGRHTRRRCALDDDGAGYRPLPVCPSAWGRARDTRLYAAVSIKGLDTFASRSKLKINVPLNFERQKFWTCTRQRHSPAMPAFCTCWRARSSRRHGSGTGLRCGIDTASSSSRHISSCNLRTTPHAQSPLSYQPLPSQRISTLASPHPPPV